MAAKKKRKPGRPASTTGKAKTTRARKSTAKNNTALARSIIQVLYSSVLLFFFLNNFHLFGKWGERVSRALFETFGFINYLMPVLIFFIIQYLLKRALETRAVINAISAVILIWMLQGMLEVFGITYCHGGGRMGRWLFDVTSDKIAVPGSFFLFLVVSCICLAIMTEGEFVVWLQKMFSGMATAFVTMFHVLREGLEEKIEESGQQEKVMKPVRKPITLQPAPAKQPMEETVAPTIDEILAPMMEEEQHIDKPQPVQPVEEVVITSEETPQPKPRRKRKDNGQAEEMEIVADESEYANYQLPPLDLLSKGSGTGAGKVAEYRETAIKLQQTLESFGVKVTITDVSCGPSVTRYEMQPEQGVKVSRIVGLSDDIKLNLAATDIRIEAPIPGKSAVGIEVPNKSNATVHFRDLIENETFERFKSKIAFAVGKDIAGKVVISDIAKMPHLLIAGATGSGKSVCINTLIMSILYKAKPNEVKLIMIDPKVVELSVYDGIPHLLIPVVTDPKKAAGALNWAVVEMTERYKKFAEVNVRNLEGYNKKVEQVWKTEGVSREDLPKMSQIVIIVDELADLMMVAPGDVEDSIVRLSQLARAAGIHLVIATQRPSVNVITGLIKANVPSRIAFAVSSGVDSRTIIDMVGAEKLLGKGDMLFYPQGYQKPARVQGAFISDQEVGAVVDFLKSQTGEREYDAEVVEKISQASTGSAKPDAGSDSDNDEYFIEAARFIIDKDKASIGSLQRVFKIGFNRAARIMDQLAEIGVVGPEEGTKPRKVLMTSEEFEEYLVNNQE
ncbi:MAG: DNA translocase FtsK [Lachnospiraceae bacterium]